MRVEFSQEEMERLECFCREKGLEIKKLLAKGHSSRIFLVQKGRKKFIAKIERSDSPRKQMLEKEVSNLRLANSVGVGPRLIDYIFFNKVILMEYIDGQTFNEWIFDKKRKGKEVSEFIEELLEQADRLDRIGLDHGQLAGRGTNILVRKGIPVIIDFEKASTKRKCHNRKVLEAFLFRNKGSAVAERVKYFLV